jgi:hypothetical protein
VMTCPPCQGLSVGQAGRKIRPQAVRVKDVGKSERRVVMIRIGDETCSSAKAR